MHMIGESSNSGLWVLLLGAAFLAVLAYGFYATAKRRSELLAWAQCKGLSFSPAKHFSLGDRFARFLCLQTGRDRYAYNIIQGLWPPGRQAICFDYHYVTGSGKNRRTHTFSAAVVTSKVPLQPLLIRPENLFDRLTEFLGFDDIDFESAEFSRAFFVKSPDRRWAYDVLHARTMEFLLAQPRFAIQFDTGCAIAYRSTVFSTRDFESACDVLSGLLDRLPEYLVQQQTGGQT